MLAVKSERNEEESEKEFAGGEDLLDAIDFDDFFAGFSDGDGLPDLETDHDAVAELSGSESEHKSGKTPDSVAVSDVGLRSPAKEFVSTTAEPESESENRGSKEAGRSGKKKKAKVDWTPELHRRFVTAVEQLGIDKAVPSRILEIMGVACLTRHNIASHLQKYRSQRKHVQAREAEAASWNRRRQIYGTAAAPTGPTQLNHWIAPAIGFPPVTHYRPLHVWGHPFVDQSLLYTWPYKHVVPPSHGWLPPIGAPCFPPQFSPAVRFLPTAVAGADVATGQTPPRTPSDVHPSMESIDAAIGDVIRKPWLPLPLGLKPPSMDSVMLELQRQGVSKIPPT